MWPVITETVETIWANVRGLLLWIREPLGRLQTVLRLHDKIAVWWVTHEPTNWWALGRKWKGPLKKLLDLVKKF